MRRSALVLAAVLFGSATASAEIQRTSLVAESDPGVSIAIREVVDTSTDRAGTPLILLHGARVPGVASFDLEVPGGSLAADLANRGLAVYIVDLRGYGDSTRPEAMGRSRTPTAPLVRSGAAVRDIGAAVDAIRTRTGSEQVSILGWATGGHWAGMYATLSPGKVSRLILLNTLYGYTADHAVIGRGSGLATAEDPGRFNIERFANYRLNPADTLLRGWDRSIPTEDKTAWRAPEVAAAYVEAALASDPTSDRRNPPSFRAPSGAMADSFLLATGGVLWDARLLTADVLIVRSANDFWSRPADLSLLSTHLGDRFEGTFRTLEIPEATHFVHLDRPERGRDLLIAEVSNFLGAGDG